MNVTTHDDLRKASPAKIPKYGVFKPNNPMKKGHVKSIDMRVPHYEEECSFLNEVEAKKKLKQH
jgi:hypothetical protein